MKALTLYIDKWYIIGAVCTDGVPRLITPSNGEDRFWLYFYEDITNETIVYGKDNKQHYHNNENHYYGDVFSLVTNTTASFMRYGRKQEMYKIFKASGIIDELKSAVDENADEVETFISFSRDISDAARLVFLQSVLEPDNFKVRESVARIGHLSLEHAFRKGQYSEDGYYLLLNACNENLSYSVYEHIDDIMLRKAEACLNGMGTDLRSRALLEKVVKNINQRNHFLDSEQDYEREYLRLGQFVDQWIVKLENAKAGRPITIPNVRLSQLPNTYDTTILKKDIDTRTHVIVDDIVREITNFVKNLNIPNDKVKGVIFLGNTFTNEQFVKAIEERYILSKDKYIFYKDTDLPNIVAVYSVIDCNQFSEAAQLAIANGETELARQKLAQEEKARQEEAIRIREIQEAKDRAARESDIKYNEAMANVYDYEKKQDYAQMLDWAEIALQHKSNENEAKQKKAEATRLLSEKKVKDEQYRSIIQRAQKSLDEKHFQDALSQSDAALNIRPNSLEAARIRTVARQQLDILETIKDIMTRVDVFIGQKLYTNALQEIEKIKSLDSSYPGINERLETIHSEEKAKQQQLSKLVSELDIFLANKKFDEAENTCHKLADIDIENSQKWHKKLSDIKLNKEKYEEATAHYKELISNIKKAQWEEDYIKMIDLCHEALEIDPLDIEVKEWLAKAIEKAEEQKVKTVVEKANSYVQNGQYYIAISIIEDALEKVPQNEVLSDLLHKYSSKAEVIRIKVDDLINKMLSKEKSNELLEAIDLCSRLLSLDVENKVKWQEELQRLQSKQIEKSELELNFRRKKADIKQLVRSQNFEAAEKEINQLRDKYISFGITSHDNELLDLLKSIRPGVSDTKEELHKSSVSIRKDRSNDKIPLKRKRTSISAVQSNKKQDKSGSENDSVNISKSKEEGNTPKDIRQGVDANVVQLISEKKFIQAKRYFAVQKNNEMAELCTELIRLDKSYQKGNISGEEESRLKEIYRIFNITI